MRKANNIPVSGFSKPRRGLLQRLAASAVGVIGFVVARGLSDRRTVAAERHAGPAGTSDITRIHRLDDNAPLTLSEAFPRDVAGIKLTGNESALAVGGNPVATYQVTYAAPDHSVSAGIWECEPGLLRLPGYPDTEYCRILTGDLVITSPGGDQQTFGPGDAFVIPKGFVGTWNMRSRVKKEWVSVK